jgi:predicted nuclease of restriction endonuclease-like (RecB) superfamily
MDSDKILEFGNAAEVIKGVIVRSRYQAAKLVNKELLSLYYAVGRYVSINSRGNWGQGSLKQLSESLQREMPGLRGFSESGIKRMRQFYEEWHPVLSNRPTSLGNLEPLKTLENFIDLNLLTQQIQGFVLSKYINGFFSVGFSHHSEILTKEKSLEGRLFYIAQCAAQFWTIEALKSNLRGDLYSKKGSLPSNFLLTLTNEEQARRAIRSFKDEYILDFINIEDENDPDERLLERSIIANIKQFILSFGNKFCFVGNQYRIMVEEQEFFIDLLFFNRELHCLVAVELKRGTFKPAHLGQLNFYLSALDKYVRQEDENPTIGILLCKEANRSVVEFAVRDYTKPMGVATFRTRNEMPPEYQNALPDLDEIQRLLDATEGTNDEDK